MADKTTLVLPGRKMTVSTTLKRLIQVTLSVVLTAVVVLAVVLINTMMVSRTGSADAGIIKVLQDVAMKDASFDVRAATAGALGRLNLAKDVRIELMRAILAR